MPRSEITGLLFYDLFRIINKIIFKRQKKDFMRIGIDAHMLGDRSGGNESFYKGILDAFEPDEGNEYYLFLKPGYDGSAYKDRFNIVYFRSRNAFTRNLLELTILCLKYKLDLLHTQYYIPFIRPCPVICTIHDISFEHFKSMFTKSEYIRDKVLVKYAARHSKKIITVSSFSKKDISETYHIPKDKIEVIYNAVDPAFRILSEEELKEIDIRGRYGIGNSPYIICVGNLQPRKNIPRLIRAFGIYKRETQNDAKLVIVGKKAWLYEDTINAIKNSKDDISHTGYVEKEDLVALLNEAKGFIYPSIYEGFGIPPLEALICGIPIAVSDIPVMHEVLKDIPVYFDPYSEKDIVKAIKKIMNMSRYASKYDQNEFTWKASSILLRQIYNE